MPSENQIMRQIPLLLLALSGLAFTPSALPRSTDDFRLAMTRAELDSVISARGLGIISSSFLQVTGAGADPAVEYEQYEFSPSTTGQSLLWRVTVAFRVPYRRADFDSLRDALTARLGQPAQVDEPADSEIGATHRVTWVDVRTSVQLAARWPALPDPAADRMLVTWTDRRLQKLVEVQRRGGKPKKK